MSTLIAIVFHDESTAFEMRAALAKMQGQYLLEMDDAVVVTRDVKGKIKLHQAVSLTAAGAEPVPSGACSSAYFSSIQFWAWPSGREQARCQAS